MKKLAALLAVTLSCNLFVGFSAQAENTEATLHYSNNLDNMAIASYTERMPTGFTLVGDASTNYKVLDEEHSVSFGTRGSNKIRYDFGQTIIGKASFSFDVLIDGALENGKGWYIFDNQPGWSQEVLLDIQGTNLSAHWGDCGKGNIGTNEWHRVDIIIDGTASSAKFDFYLDGNSMGKSFNLGRSISSLAFMHQANDKGWVYIDNIRAEIPAGASQMTGKLLGNSKVKAEDTKVSQIRFSDTLDQTVFSEDSLPVEVTETNLATNETKTIANTVADLDVTATKLEVTYGKALSNGCKYEVTIPTTITGLSGETSATEKIEFTTYAEDELVHYVNDMDDETAAAWTSKRPAGFVNPLQNAGDQHNEVFFAKVDDEHGISFGSSGSSQYQYKFPKAIEGKASFSFDLYLNGSMSKGWYAFVGPYKDNVWDNLTLDVRETNFSFDWNKKADMEVNKWYRVDMLLEGKDGKTKVDCYFDGKLVASKTYDREVDCISFMNQGRGNAETDRVYIDNIRAEVPAGGNEIKGELITSANDYANFISKSKIRLSDTIAKATFVNGSKVEVVEKDLATNKERKLANATGALEGTTTFVVTYNEALKDNCTYTIKLPEGFTGLSGEKMAAEQTVVVTTKPSLEYFDNFESYADWEQMPSFGENHDFDRTEGAYGTGKAVKKTNNAIFYAMPEQMNKGKLVYSFDYKKFENQERETKIGFNLNNWDWNDAINFTNDGKIKIDWEEKETTFVPGTWNHYDIVWDLDTKVMTLYQNGDEVGTHACYPINKIKFMSNGDADNLAGYAVDNFHVRFFGENKVTTNLTGTISANTTVGKIAFKDAVDPDSISVMVIGDGAPVSVTIQNATPYGAEIVFDDGLEKDIEYFMTLDGVTSYSGEDFDCSDFTFVTSDVFAVSSIEIESETTKVTKAADWDKNVNYTIVANVESTRTTETEITLVVAGYSATGMVQIKTVPVTVTGSATYYVSLGQLDMKGATTIKCFAIDSMTNLSPLMAAPTIL